MGGLRLSVIHGRNQSVRGVDFGLISLSETGNLTGFSAVLGMGRLDGNLRGAATGLVNQHRGTDVGLNVAVFNDVRRVRGGANVGVLNVVQEDSSVDLGGVNVSERSIVQLGVVNVTRNIRGVQIGFLNIADNGFLPVFPIFNFPKR